jgi:hypothetical protein
MMRSALAMVVLLLGLGRAVAQPVDLALVLAVDVSGSVDATRFDLQRQGYAAAFRNPRVLAAIHAGPVGSIAIVMVQWTGPAMQAVVVPWLRIADAASAAAAADAIAAAPRKLFGGGTSISGAIDSSVKLLAAVPFEPTRRVIDISGDGANNRGDPPAEARDAAVAKGIGINGLPIVSLEPGLDDYYHNHVMGGPGAFVVVADSYEDFAVAIAQKLITEIAAHP